MSSIEIKNLTKSFKETVALKNVDLKFESGKIYGLLGRNGAGKTTLINVLTNRLFPDSGYINIDGESVTENDRVQSKIFCMTEKSGYPSDMKVKDAFKWVKLYYPDFDTVYADGLIKKFALDTKKRIRALSTGYSSILKLIMALASNAEVVIFDEPVLGLDAGFRDLFYKELLKNFEQRQNIVIVCTHLISEIENMIEHAVIIKQGSVIASSPVEDLLKNAYTVAGEAGKIEEFSSGKQAVRTEKLGSYCTASFLGTLSETDKAFVKKNSLEVFAPKLQDLFVSMTNPEA